MVSIAATAPAAAHTAASRSETVAFAIMVAVLVVVIGLPTGLTAGLVFQGWVSADDVVTVRATNASTGAINQGAALFRVEVRRYA